LRVAIISNVQNVRFNVDTGGLTTPSLVDSMVHIILS